MILLRLSIINIRLKRMADDNTRVDIEKKKKTGVSYFTRENNIKIVDSKRFPIQSHVYIIICVLSRQIVRYFYVALCIFKYYRCIDKRRGGIHLIYFYSKKTKYAFYSLLTRRIFTRVRNHFENPWINPRTVMTKPLGRIRRTESSWIYDRTIGKRIRVGKILFER